MLESTVPVKTQTLWLFRHGHSRANASSDRPVAAPQLFSFAQKVLGPDRSLQLAKAVDWYLRKKHTPYEVIDRKIPLERLGKEQAYATGRKLAEMGIFPEVMIVSTYLRTRQTAEGIVRGIESASGKPQSIMLLYSDLITERWSGKIAGFPNAYRQLFFPEVHQALLTQGRIDHRPPGGESIRDVREKRIPPLRELLDHLNFKTIFMVGHGLTNSCIRSLLTGEAIETVRIGSPNLGVYKFTRSPGQAIWSLDQHYDGSRPFHPDIPDKDKNNLY